MERKSKIVILLGFIALVCGSFAIADWGFYAHRKINYYAVLTVPPPVNQFLKSHIEYLQQHAVDPDRRRYAMPDEGSRHFIDLDKWHVGDSCVLSKDYTLDRIFQGDWQWKTDDASLVLRVRLNNKARLEFNGIGVHFTIDSFALRQEVYQASTDTTTTLISSFLYPDHVGQLIFTDTFSQHGVIPYSVEILYSRLIREMEEMNVNKIIKTCADMGHYIADAHVPLHTTSNYNGQYTDQLGIHAFWESRIPELFEEEYFNSLVGRAKYIDDVHEFIWSVVEHSYSLVPEVLDKERIARKKVSEQDHYCFEERGNILIRTPCPVLAREYMNLMDGMVQDQWRAAIHSIGSVWYSAWVDAGKPDLWSPSTVIDRDTNLLNRVLGKLRRSGSDQRSELH